MKDGGQQSSASFRAIFASVLVLGLIVFASIFASAQGIVTGSISAVVQDPQGAVVVGARVSARQLDTNREFETETNSVGLVALRDLPPGVYSLRIEGGNFQPYEASNVSVEVGKDTTLAVVKLQLGSATETVTVESAPPLVESTTDQISETFSSEKVSSLPVGNTFDSLALFIPGVATAGDASFSNNNGAEELGEPAKRWRSMLLEPKNQILSFLIGPPTLPPKRLSTKPGTVGAVQPVEGDTPAGQNPNNGLFSWFSSESNIEPCQNSYAVPWN